MWRDGTCAVGLSLLDINVDLILIQQQPHYVFFSFFPSVVARNGTFPKLARVIQLQLYMTGSGSDHVTSVIAVRARQEAAVVRGGL